MNVLLTKKSVFVCLGLHRIRTRGFLIIGIIFKFLLWLFFCLYFAFWKEKRLLFLFVCVFVIIIFLCSFDFWLRKLSRVQWHFFAALATWLPTKINSFNPLLLKIYPAFFHHRVCSFLLISKAQLPNRLISCFKQLYAVFVFFGIFVIVLIVVMQALCAVLEM